MEINVTRQDEIKISKYLLPYNLQFFAGEGTDKTEEPTAKKLSDARLEGQAAKSKELITASGLAMIFVILKIYIGMMGSQFIKNYQKSFAMISKFADDFSMQNAEAVLNDAITSILLICMPIFITVVLVSFVVVLMQVKWKISGKLIKPKFSNINPLNGFKRLLSKDKVFELVIECIKIVIICYIAYKTLKDQWVLLYKLYDMKLEQAILLIGNIIINLGLKISLIFLLIGFADLIYQKMKFKKDMRMTKQEVKDEYKNSEGDPQIKNKIRSKMREASMKRMMQSLPNADVVITNPTHFAAAIKYDKASSAAPVLLAKGADYLAQKIREAAKENHIEIVENKPLARMLYYNVEVGEEIPPELYQMTAEVLAYVYGLKNKV
jgi:flagellar biosynthetic protein FlhB